VSVTGKDTNGNSLSSPVSWNFRTAYAGQVGGACPCTIFSDSTVPAIVTANDPNSVELGVKFTADTDGIVTGVRFYKGPQNIGSHTGTLWSATGTQLATATFSNESSTGWQTVSFATPVTVTAGTTYIASYHTTVGYYSVTMNAYSSSGVDNFPLHVPANGSLYTYGGGAPNSTSASDYGVDVVFTVPASVVPTVTSTDPSDGDSNLSVNSPIKVNFSTSILAGTTSVAVTQNGGGQVSGTTTLNPTHDSLTFTPAQSLVLGATYSVTVSGARSLSGTAQSNPATWTFTTAGSTTCPCSLFASNATPAVIDSGDTSALTLGVQVTPSASGFLTGVRFYKAATNTGVHKGSVWSTSGTRLGSVTFTGESASGWQKATFSQPVPVVAGTTYIVSYYAPNGHYSYNSHFFDTDFVNGVLTVPGGGDGVYRYGGDVFPTDTYASANYWVDAIFNTAAGTDTVPPSVSSSTPLDGATSVTTSVAPTATFSEPVSSGSIVMTVKASGNAVAGAISYDAASRTATFTPGSPLAKNTLYTVSVSAADTAGNTMANPETWKFTTVQPTPAPGVCPCSVWDDSATPDVLADVDSRPVELGMQFTADDNGQVLGVRFYKGAVNTGAHTGTLWSSSGQQLATGTFTGESTTGWQTLTFGSPVSVTAGTTYVVSYHTNTGGFSYTTNQFATVGVDNAPLHVPAHAALYRYGDGAFPTTASDSNYWVDPVFTKVVADTTPPVISGINAGATGTTLTVTWTTDENSTSRVDYGTSAAALSQNATGSGLATSHSVDITGIAPNTRYYFRVTSADASSNAATSPASPNAPSNWAPTVTPLADSTVADFTAGTASSTYVAANSDGEVVLTPTAVTEFTGTTLPSGWTATNGSGGSAAVAGGAVTLTNSTLTTSATFTSGKSLETIATLGKNQSIGWVSSSSSSLKFSYTVSATNQLIANVNDGAFTNTTSTVATGWTPASHKFRIELNSSSVTFYLDDVQKFTRSINLFVSNLRPSLSDTVTTDGGLLVDWVRVGPYAASGTFTSRVLDGKAQVGWDALTWISVVPTGTTVVMRARTGDTATPDGSWSAYATIPSSGGLVNKTSRYIQYQLSYTSTGTRYVTPAVLSVTVAFHI
jgi:methionine-rich copper-binding protein CopC